MYVRLSKLRKVVAEQAQHLFEELKQEDRDRLRRGVQDNWPGESHDNYEESLELEDFEFGEAKKKDEEEPEEDNSSDQEGGEKKEKPAFLKGKGKDTKPKKKSPPKEKEPEEDVPEDSGEEEEEPKKEPSPKHKKAKKGLEKAQKQKSLPKSQVDPKTGMKQDIDLDQLAQLATEMGYRLERNEPEGEDDLDLDLGDDSLSGDDDEMNFDLGSLGDLGGEDEEDHEEDVEGEDVALVSSDEDIADVLGLGGDEYPEDELGLEGDPLSMKKSLPAVKQGASKQGGLKLRIK